MSWISDQFGRKRCQKKRKDVDYNLLIDFFQKKFVVHERWAVKNPFSTYVCYAPDGLFWLNLYVLVIGVSRTETAAPTLPWSLRCILRIRKQMDGSWGRSIISWTSVNEWGLTFQPACETRVPRSASKQYVYSLLDLFLLRLARAHKISNIIKWRFFCRVGKSRNSIF